MQRTYRTKLRIVVAALGALVLHVAVGGPQATHEFTIPASDFNRGNVRVSLVGQQYASVHDCIWHGGELPNAAEYDITFPAAGFYTLLGLYTANDSRPVDILLDGVKVHTGFSGTTGSWDTLAATWEEQCTFQVAEGKHILRLQRDQCMPHICALRFRGSVPFPEGWCPDRGDLGDGTSGDSPARIVISAPDYDQGNIRVSKPGQDYAGRYPCIWDGGTHPNWVEYQLEFPVGADYTFHALFTAQQSRPVDILLDGTKVHTGLRGVTGDWGTDHAAWEKQCTLPMGQGVHTIRLECASCFPHISALRFDSPVPFPPGWTLRRPGLEQRRAREAEERRIQAAQAALALINPEALEQAIADRIATFPELADVAGELAARVSAIAMEKESITRELLADGGDVTRRVTALQTQQRSLMTYHPLLTDAEMMCIKRPSTSPALGLPCNWQSNCSLPKTGYRDEILRIPVAETQHSEVVLFSPEKSVFLGDIDLHWDAGRLLFSSIGGHGCWQVFEVGIDGKGLRQVTPGLYDDVDNYDACYLPDDSILFTSTRAYASVPCVNGSSRVANIFRMSPDGSGVRQLCFDQEHNWCPTVMNDGRVLFTRWEYVDTPHTHSRLLFSMNPDGTQQMAFYGSNSYWPNAMFYTRPIPGHASQVATIVSGHHGVARMGELLILDPRLGRHEADGVVQRIPGRGKIVEPLIEDCLVDSSWPKFLHPYPLGDPSRPETCGKLFLTACQPSAESLWGIYLVDIFDNIVLLHEEPGFAFLEPILLRAKQRPPVIPDKIDLTRSDCIAQITDIYQGPGLAGIPRGTVKSLRVFSYTYDYPDMGGPQGVVGLEGPWDVRRILGTVPVEADGSVSVRLPANTPISLQPLDSEGRAVQIMRSWLTGMPGEVISCVGCHEPQNTGSPNLRTLANQSPPRDVTPWRGPPRGFSFAREVQPVLDSSCVTCHDGAKRADGSLLADLRGTESITDYDSRYHHGGRDAGKFTVAYAALQRFVRRPGLESDYHLLPPMDFHATTTQLYQMLQRGHHGVQLNEEAWDRLVTWIDLNAPYHGSWTSIAGAERVLPVAQRRREMLNRYAGMDTDFEWTGPSPAPTVATLPRREEVTDRAPSLEVVSWPLGAETAARQQREAGPESLRTIDLGDGLILELALIPGATVTTSVQQTTNLKATSKTALPSFWMGRFEVTNEQYSHFDPRHDSRLEIRHAMQFGVQGWPLNRPRQPVVRVSWEQATAFCEWLSEKTGESFSLPTEMQWEYACRAGSNQPYWFGGAGTDFSAYANLADVTLRNAVSDPYQKVNAPLPNPTRYDDWIPRDQQFSDGQLVSSDVGLFSSNPWGLCDMHGNVWEWTASGETADVMGPGSNQLTDTQLRRIVRGGSWRDRPHRATASFRLAYVPFQRVYNVGFRVVCPSTPQLTSR